jgi:hypothetical protein
VYSAETTLVVPGSRTQPAVSAPPAPPAQWHRVLTLLADIGLLIGTRAVWTTAAAHRPAVAAVISLCYASILACGVLALVVRRARSLARVGLCVLVTGVTLTLCAWIMLHHGSDEALLTTQAARELAAGRPVYEQPWPWLFGHDVALTPTVTGGYDFTYGYPPLAPLLIVPLLWLGHGGTPATAVSTGALIAGTVVLWRLLPAPWRSAATLVCLGRPKTRLTYQIACLQHAGLVTRRSVCGDGRGVEVALTDKARSLLAEASAPLSETVTESLARFMGLHQCAAMRGLVPDLAEESRTE